MELIDPDDEDEQPMYTGRGRGGAAYYILPEDGPMYEVTSRGGRVSRSGGGGRGRGRATYYIEPSDGGSLIEVDSTYTVRGRGGRGRGVVTPTPVVRGRGGGGRGVGIRGRGRAPISLSLRDTPIAGIRQGFVDIRNETIARTNLLRGAVRGRVRVGRGRGRSRTVNQVNQASRAKTVTILRNQILKDMGIIGFTHAQLTVPGVMDIMMTAARHLAEDLIGHTQVNLTLTPTLRWRDKFKLALETLTDEVLAPRESITTFASREQTYHPISLAQMITMIMELRHVNTLKIRLAGCRAKVKLSARNRFGVMINQWRALNDTFAVTSEHWIAMLLGIEVNQLQNVLQRYNQLEVRGSDPMDEEDFEFNGDMHLTLQVSHTTPTNHGDESGGAFFRYWLSEEFPDDLSIIQVYKESQHKILLKELKEGRDLEGGYYEVDCLGHSLLMMEVPLDKVLRYFALTAHNPTPWIPTSKLRILADELDLNLSITYYSKNQMSRNKDTKLYRGDMSTEVFIPLGRVEGHYVPDVYSDWTRWAVRNVKRIGETFKGHEAYQLEDIKLSKKMDRVAGVDSPMRLKCYRSREEAMEYKALATYGEILCILTYGVDEERGPSGRKRSRNELQSGFYTLYRQERMVEEITPDEYLLRTNMFMYFKEAVKNRKLAETLTAEQVVEMGTRYCKENKGTEQSFLNIPEPIWATDVPDYSWGQRTLVTKQGKPGVDTCSYEYFEFVFKNFGLLKKHPWDFRDKMVKQARVITTKEPNMEHMRLDIKTHYNVIAFDFETTTDGDIHKPYMCSIAFFEHLADIPFSFRETDDFLTGDIAVRNPLTDLGAIIGTRSFYGKDCGQQMIDFIVQNNRYVQLILIAHNMRYDLNQLMASSSSVIEDGIFKTASRTNCATLMLKTTGGVEEKRVLLLDTLQLMPMDLRSLAKTFELQMEKEYMPYQLYNEDFFRRGYGPDLEMDRNVVLEKAKNDLGGDQSEGFKSFYSNCVLNLNMNLTSGNFEAMKYATFYCERDCEILLMGFTKNREEVAKVQYIDKHGEFLRCNLDVVHAVSVAQLASHMLGKSGCFEGTFLLSGTLRDYISTSVVGGRTMLEANVPHEVNENIQNMDACSLYPSAMKRIAEKFSGFPMGLPKMWSPEVNLRGEEIVYYVITVMITKVGIPRTFPLLSTRTSAGGRHFTNMLEGELITMDKVSWEDIQRFQGVEGEIRCGLYFDQGGNKKIGELIQYMYDKRKELKDEGKNAAQVVMKLMMNSAYGRTIMKPIETDMHFLSGEDRIDKYLGKHNVSIKTISMVRDDFCIVERHKSVFTHFSQPQIGSFILSTSKQIMNEVMCLAEDNGMRIHYQDTDSMHMLVKDMPRLGEVFYQEYGRPLYSVTDSPIGILKPYEKEGEHLGLFHGDFEKLKGYEEAESINSIYCGKKMYINVLQYREIGAREKTKLVYHTKLKGVPKSALIAYYESIKEEYGYNSMLDVYKSMLYGERHKIDLLKSNKVFFHCTKDMKVRNRLVFERTVGTIEETSKLAYAEAETLGGKFEKLLLE